MRYVEEVLELFTYGREYTVQRASDIYQVLAKWHFSKHFPCINLLNPHNNPERGFISLISQKGKQAQKGQITC